MADTSRLRVRPICPNPPSRLRLPEEGHPAQDQDRSLMPASTLTAPPAKMVAYEAMMKANLHRERFGWSNFRVVVISVER